MITGWGKTKIVGAILAASFIASPALGEALQIGDTAPLFTLKALNPGTTKQAYINFSDYAQPLEKGGKKAIFLSFFANSCEPCKKELPYLVELQKAYADNGFQVLLITIDKDASEVAKARTLR